MNSEDFDNPDSELDDAVTQRLAKLRAMPVDTSRLDSALRARIPRPQKIRLMRLRPVQAVAASFVLVTALTAALFIATSSGPALAEATQMAQVHQDIVSGRLPIMRVSSIEQANRMLAVESPGAPSLPQLPQEHVMACCMKSVHNKKMACVLLKQDGTPITLAVAKASEMKLPPAPQIVRNGTSYRAQSVGRINMVMTERNGRWLCLMGEVPADRLVDVAAQVQF
jgi:hypothetical protein